MHKNFQYTESLSLFRKFNRKSIDDRQIDTLIGLSKGLLADGKVDLSEAEVLLNWLAQNRANTENPVIRNLFEVVDSMLADGVLDPDESAEISSVLRKITGEDSALGEVAKSTTLPLDDPAPEIIFPDRVFLFTGTCCFGTRKQCHEALESLGSQTSTNVTKSLDYLVIGTYVTDAWAHETFGRKIEKAMQYRNNGIPLVIVSEEHWAECAGF